jgi:predicted enzyme related to lactoylglutathione lyase
MSEGTKKQAETPKQGTFCWDELATTDMEASKKFYSEIFGWHIKSSENADAPMEYAEFGTDENHPVGGIMEMKAEMYGGTIPTPHWLSYITVDDVDSAAKKTVELGGEVVGPLVDIPNVGRMAIVNDPTGAKTALLQFIDWEPPANEPAFTAHGRVCWKELATQDLAKSKEFYSKLLGWEFAQNEAIKMEYPEIQVGGTSIGGMLQMTDEWKDAKTGEFMPSHWMTYISVEDCDATAEKIKENGGGVCVPPTDIPPVGRFSVVNDPSGAIFSIIKLSSE